MEDASLLSQLLPSLGAFAPAALLGFWIIRNLSETLKAERERNIQLTDKVITVLQANSQAMAELRAALKGGG